MSNNYSTNLRILVGALEDSPGTMEVLDASDFDVRVRNPEFTPTVEVDDEGSKWANGNHGEDASITGVTTAQVTFTVRAAVASAVNAQPNWWKFAEGCGCLPVAYASAGYGLQPRKSYDEKTMTLWVYDIQRGGTGNAIVYKIAGASGNMVLAAEGVGKPWMATFTFTGKMIGWSDIAAANVPSPYGLDTTCADKFLMDSVYVDAIAQKVSSFSLDQGNDIQPVYDQSDDTGISHYGIISRKPRLSINPLMSALSVDDVWARLTNGTTGAPGATGCADTFPVHLGDTGGNTQYSIMVPKAQLLAASIASREGLQGWDQNYKMLGNGVTGSVSDGDLEEEVTWELLTGARS